MLAHVCQNSIIFFLEIFWIFTALIEIHALPETKLQIKPENRVQPKE